MKNKYPSQEAEVFEYMKTHPFITQAHATESFGCTRLAAVIKNMRNVGIPIKTNMVYYTKPNGRPGRYAEYYLELK